MSTTTWKSTELFYNPDDDHVCCTCSAAFSPVLAPGESWRETLVNIAGQWLTDRYVVIRAYRIRGEINDLTEVKGDTVPELLTTSPASEPPESGQAFNPSKAAKLLAAGIEIREGGEGKAQPLYHEGQHIGWIQPAPYGAKLTEVRRYMRIVKEILERPRSADGYTSDPVEAFLSTVTGSPLDALMMAHAALDKEAGR